MTISTYPNRFLDSLTIGGLPILQTHPGEIFWVNSTTVLPKNGVGSSDGNKGTYTQPFKTLDYAISRCKASRGDIIVLMPGHNEDYDASTSGDNKAFDVDIAGVTIVGLGQGELRPTFDFTNAGAKCVIGADNVVLKNIVFRPSVTDITIGLEIETGITSATLEDIDFAMGEAGDGTDEYIKAIHLVSGNHDTIFRNVKIFAHASAAGATHGIHIDAASDRLTFQNVIIDGPYATNGILEDAAGLNHIMEDCSVSTTGTNYGFASGSTFAKRVGNLDSGVLEGEAAGESSEIFYVDSGTGVDSGDGNKFNPFATVDFAIAQCTASSGAIINVMPGHAETIAGADGFDADVVGISIIGHGVGTDRPTFTYTATGSTVAIGADNVLIENMVFNASITAITLGITIEANIDYTTIRNCQFGVDADATDEFLDSIHLVSGNIGTLIEGNTFDMGVGTANHAIHMDADTERTVIANNIVHGSYAVACIKGDSTLSTDILIVGNILQNGVGGALVAQPAIELLTATTGTIKDNVVVCNVADPAASIVADTCMMFNNKYSETITEAALDLPIKLGDTCTIDMKKDALTTLDDLFTIGTGSVLVHGLWFICTTAETGGTNPVVSLKLDIDSGTDVVIATGLDLASIAISDTLTFNALGSVLIKTAGGALTSPHAPFVLAPGVVESVLDSGSYSAGDGTWCIVTSPITSGATVAAA